jgi:hypothetical protein
VETNWLEVVLNILSNASVAAFLGAFFAFSLVALTDLRRRHSRKSLLMRRIKVVRALAGDLVDAADTNIEILRDNRFSSAPVMGFPVDDVRVLQRECLDLLSETETLAIDALVYWMEAIDGLFEGARSLSVELEGLAKANAPTAERSRKGDEILGAYADAKKNLGYFVTLTGFVIDGAPEKVRSFTHEVS